MAIVDDDTAARAGWDTVALAGAFIEGGARLLQLRAKTLASGSLLAAAAAIVARGAEAGAVVVVNDRADVAAIARAGGVHVGQDDLDPASVRRVVGPDAIVGFSTHTDAQIADALERPISYLAIGPVFGTATKATGYDAVGLAAVERAAAAAGPRGIPVVAIGGITLDRAAEVMGAGAACVAVIGDLLASGDPAGRVRAYLDRLG
jgi:thiamine-phosphate pyrophosphorylase